MGLMDDLLTTLPDGVVQDVQVGAFWTAVVAEVDGRRRCGLASTLRNDDHHHGGGAPVQDAGRLTERSALELAELARSRSLTEAAIGMAAINALLTSGLSPSARVLVVDPDDAARERMILTIQAQGYRVAEARSAEEALALAERVSPGLALINAPLAQARDYWLLRQLRQLSAGMDILVLADALSEAEGREAISRGASGYGETGELPDLLDQVRSRPAGE
jgi:CheY-like chemotaxis protein